MHHYCRGADLGGGFAGLSQDATGGNPYARCLGDNVDQIRSVDVYRERVMTKLGCIRPRFGFLPALRVGEEDLDYVGFPARGLTKWVVAVDMGSDQKPTCFHVFAANP
jgi:hypothetical protein